MPLGDVLLEGGVYKNLASGIEYEEKRVFLANIFLVKFIFLTRYDRRHAVEPIRTFAVQMPKRRGHANIGRVPSRFRKARSRRDQQHPLGHQVSRLQAGGMSLSSSLRSV